MSGLTRDGTADRARLIHTLLEVMSDGHTYIHTYIDTVKLKCLPEEGGGRRGDARTVKSSYHQ